ncbi:blast:Polycystic kidney disease and receptor for egg jelly-related protein [Mytilus galloprovincialis]|uniref:Blast:Polycystic kidney disease and receptor for egg jelly-related protein n=1 Tax=Mytilus galloprovincialis TaxID=29158 RepID=A0A8B6BTS7_MYTGA|nr:blast:Polycystic kidney disease and receptor for egg jelly-related protein [Mytilus galloprovincialis]
MLIIVYRTCRLPWWVIYIAWTTVSLTSLTTSFFVMLYGLKYGYYESLEWLVSFITAFVDDVVILEPLTIVIFAVIITFILKRPVRIGDAPPQIVQGSEGRSKITPHITSSLQFPSLS